MSDSGRAWPGRARTFAAATLGVALAPWAGALPAAAASPSPSPLPVPPAAAPAASASPTPNTCQTIRYGATAAADVLQVTTLNSDRVGVSAAAIANLGIGEARATLSTKPIRLTAAAGALGGGSASAASAATAHTEAPPNPAGGGDHATAGATDMGALKLGADHLDAAAHWFDGYRCGARLGEASTSTARLTHATVLPASGQSLLHVSGDLAGATTTGLLKHNGHAASAAGASLRLSELTLFEGTGAQVGVRVLTAPSLNVIASGEKATSSVRYAAPVLGVTAADGSVHRLDSPGAHLDLPVPASLFASLPHGSSAVLRLSLGTVTSRITDTEVNASALSLRVQVELTEDHASALPATGGATVLDLGIGALTVSADAAKAAATSSGGGYGSGSGSNPSSTPSATGTVTASPSSSLGSGSGSGGGTLPVTGASLTWVLVAGGLLASAGYALMLMARRRRAG